MNLSSLIAPPVEGDFIRPGFAAYESISRGTHGPTAPRRRTAAGQAFIRAQRAWLTTQSKHTRAPASPAKTRYRQWVAAQFAEHRRRRAGLSRHATRP